MSKVEIDAEKLKILLEAFQSLLIPETTEVVKDSTVVEKKKRGRPSKKTSPEIAEEIVTAIADPIGEPVEEVLSYVPPVPAKNTKPSYLAEAKRVDFVGASTDRKADVKEDYFDRKRGRMKFVDERSVPPDSDELKARYAQAEQSEPRPAKQKVKLTCDKCTKTFEIYPSECPQAFTRFSAPGMPGIESKPLIRCNDCTVGR